MSENKNPTAHAAVACRPFRHVTTANPSSLSYLFISSPTHLINFIGKLVQFSNMAEHYGQYQGGRPHQQLHQPRSHQMVKAATAVTAGGSLLLLSGLTLAGTVIALTIATPLLVIFSPVLVPATLAILTLGSGFLASGGFGVAALSVLSWIYRYMTGKHPPGADQLDSARTKLASKARDMKDRAEHNVLGAQTS